MEYRDPNPTCLFKKPHYNSLWLIKTHFDSLFRRAFPIFILHVDFAFPIVVLPAFAHLFAFACQTIVLPFHLIYRHALFSFCILFLYSLSIWCQVCLYCTVQSWIFLYCALCSFLLLFLLLLSISSILMIFLKTVSKILVQHAPNTHMWLVPSHSGLLHHTPPYLHEFLGGFFCCCYLFPDFCLFFHNMFYNLHSQGHNFFFIVVHCLFYFSLNKCQFPDYS
jgi:hypothetical protein